MRSSIPGTAFSQTEDPVKEIYLQPLPSARPSRCNSFACSRNTLSERLSHIFNLAVTQRQSNSFSFFPARKTARTYPQISGGKSTMKRTIAQALLLALAAGISTLPAVAQDVRITGVPFANAKSGHPDNVISPGFQLVLIAQGTDKLENPSGIIN